MSRGIGFWRLWLFVSVLWGIAVAAAFIGLEGTHVTKHYYYSPSADVLESGYWSLREADEFREGRTLTVAFSHGISVSFVRATTDGGKPVILLRAIEGPGRDVDIWLVDPTDPKATGRMATLAERAASLHRQEMIRTASIWICVLFGPPIALLVLGLAVRWVLKGFRSGDSVE